MFFILLNSSPRPSGRLILSKAATVVFKFSSTSATSFMLDDEVGYIKVTRFAGTTYNEFTDAISKLMNNGMNRLLIDLRNNKDCPDQETLCKF